MRICHYKLLIIGLPSWTALQAGIAGAQYTPGARSGFLPAKTDSKNAVSGRYVYTRVEARTHLDPETLEPVDEPVETLAVCHYAFDFTKGLAMVERTRAGFNALYECLDQLPDVHAEFEDLNLNLLDLMFELQGAYKKNMIKSLRISDYLARENMLTSTAFKLLEPLEGDKIAEKFSDQLDAFTLTLKLPDGIVSLTVTRRGTVRASDDCPDELLLLVKDLLPRFHEAEVETATVMDPKA